MKATCPCCGHTVVVTNDGHYPRHRVHGPGCGTNGCLCEASGWLVEDAEVAA